MIQRCHTCKWWTDNPNFKEHWGACGAAKDEDGQISVAHGDMMTYGLFSCRQWKYRPSLRTRGGKTGPRISLELRDKAFEIYAQTRSIQLTATCIGHSRVTVRNWLVAAGLYQPKSRSEYLNYRERRELLAEHAQPRCSDPSYSPPTSPQS